MAKGSKAVTNNIKGKGHNQDNPKHGTEGNIKGKGNANMKDNEINASQKKSPKGWYDIQQGEPFV